MRRLLIDDRNAKADEGALVEKASMSDAQATASNAGSECEVQEDGCGYRVRCR